MSDDPGMTDCDEWAVLPLPLPGGSPQPRGTHQPISVADQATAYREAQLIASSALFKGAVVTHTLRDTITSAALDPCPDHKPVQHRDGSPPWCNTCGRTLGGLKPTSRLDRKQKS